VGRARFGLEEGAGDLVHCPQPAATLHPHGRAAAQWPVEAGAANAAASAEVGGSAPGPLGGWCVAAWSVELRSVDGKRVRACGALGVGRATARE
jgi:hypothetical protein